MVGWAVALAGIFGGAPSSPWSSSFLAMGQESAPVVMADAVMSQPVAIEVLVVVQLEESSPRDAQDTQ